MLSNAFSFVRLIQLIHERYFAHTHADATCEMFPRSIEYPNPNWEAVCMRIIVRVSANIIKINNDDETLIIM